MLRVIRPSAEGPRRRGRWRALWLLWGILPLLLAVGCGGGESETVETSDSTAVAEADTSESSEPERKEKTITVDAAEVRQGELVIPIYADGAIRTPRSVEVRTKVAGEVVDVYVRDGDRVRRGQLLAKIDERPYILDLEESRYRHLQALTQIAVEGDTLNIKGEILARFEEQRGELEDLHRRGQLTRTEYQARLLKLELEALQDGAFRSEVLSQRTGLADAVVSEERAKLNLENTEIRAPFNGIVQGVDVVPGEIASIGITVCQVYNNERLEAAVNVLEADLGNLVEGRPVLLAIPATGDTLRARVDVISPYLDESSRTCEVLVRFENTEGRFRPGMFVRAEIAGWIYPDLLQVPKAAVLTRDDRPLVFKVVEDRAQWLYVDTGLENANWVEILNVHSGGSLAPGEKVVVTNHLTLAHEAKIKVRRTQPPKDRWALASNQAGESP
jgi:RND family efflux transporter MFP subunit